MHEGAVGDVGVSHATNVFHDAPRVVSFLHHVNMGLDMLHRRYAKKKKNKQTKILYMRMPKPMVCLMGTLQNAIDLYSESPHVKTPSQEWGTGPFRSQSLNWLL